MIGFAELLPLFAPAVAGVLAGLFYRWRGIADQPEGMPESGTGHFKHPFSNGG